MPDHERFTEPESPEQVLQAIQQALTGIPIDAMERARDDFCDMKDAEREYYLGRTDRKPFTAIENSLKEKAGADKSGFYEKALNTFERHYRRLMNANIMVGKFGFTKVNEDQLRAIGRQPAEPGLKTSATPPQK